MSNKEELETTTNSTIYKRIKNSIISICAICAPHKGCNRQRKKKNRNWKEYKKIKHIS